MSRVTLRVLNHIITNDVAFVSEPVGKQLVYVSITKMEERKR